MPGNPCPRAVALHRLSEETFDLLVIGAGIIGARVALEATLSGLKVALVDAGDFGGGTSSASSKLIHGGLRYMRRGDFGLVREAHMERRALMTRVAPHLVRGLDFLVPVYPGAPDGPLVVGAGMLLYSALSGFRQSRGGILSARRARSLVPPLRVEGLRACGIYRDAQTNDTRLVLATVTAAARAGAVVLNRARVTALDGRPGGVAEATVLAGSDELRVRARSCVNAAGPWVDAVRQLEAPGVRPMARLSKGVHLTLPLPEGMRAALTVQQDRGRVTFAVPWEGLLLLGTTDTPYQGDPSDITVASAEIDEVLGEAAKALDPAVVARTRVLSSFAGLRVLPMGEGDVAGASREHVVAVGPRGVVSVAGGKLTTHRQIAIDVLRRLPGFPSGHFRLHEDPLPGASAPSPRPNGIDEESWAHLVHFYGSEAVNVLDYGSPERIHPAAPDVWAQVGYAVENEWAMELDDILRRRTTLWYRGLAGEVAERVADATAGRGPVFVGR